MSNAKEIAILVMNENERSRTMGLIDEILDEFKDINYAYNDSSKFDTLKRMLIDAVEELQQFVDYYEQSARDYWKEACKCKQRIAELEAKMDRKEQENGTAK